MFMNNPVFSNKSKKEKKIFIVNISKDPRGSFNITSQTIEILKENHKNYTFYVFCRMDELLKYKSPSIKIILINLNIFQRFFFESSFLINWSKKNHVYADLIISCQNTSINYFKHTPQIITFQQGISLSEFNWNFFDKDQRSLWFYKNIYHYFVLRYIRNNTTIIVPTDWVKSSMIKKWKINPNQVRVISNKLFKYNISTINNLKSDNKYHIIYPANSQPHKNHIVILKALNRLRDLNKNIYNSIILHLTISIEDSKQINDFVLDYNLNNKIVFEGQIKFSKILEFYKNYDLLLFPSYIESFGYPLAEAAMFGMPIIASDFPYARDVIYGYDGVKFIKYNDPLLWANSIISSFKLKKKYKCYSKNYKNQWSSINLLVDNILK